MAKINLIAPWDEYYEELNAFFTEDPDVTILYDEEAKNIKVLVQNSYKAEALTHLLKDEIEFGSVKLTITVVPANEVTSYTKKQIANMNNEDSYAELYRQALAGNRIYTCVYTVDNVMGFNAVFVIFEKKVIQYYNDNLGDLNGIKSTLAENIARDIFVPHNGVFFCTDVRNNITYNNILGGSITPEKLQYGAICTPGDC